MLPAKQAIQKAVAFVVEMYPDRPNLSPRLEEIEKTDDQSAWLVTVSIVTDDVRTVAQAMGIGGSRDYKLVRVDAETGEVDSMKIRPIRSGLA